jgi:hypothetical protein
MKDAPPARACACLLQAGIQTDPTGAGSSGVQDHLLCQDQRNVTRQLSHSVGVQLAYEVSRTLLPLST